LKSNAFYAKNEYEAAKNANIMVFATEWKQFRALDWAKLSKIVNNKVIFDMRNIVDSNKAQQNNFELYKVGINTKSIENVQDNL
jgi:UDPglucose 6-dehydrogenase